MLILFMLQNKKSFELKVFKLFAISLNFFVNVVQKCYSIIQVLTAYLIYDYKRISEKQFQTSPSYEYSLHPLLIRPSKSKWNYYVCNEYILRLSKGKDDQNLRTAWGILNGSNFRKIDSSHYFRE